MDESAKDALDQFMADQPQVLGLVHRMNRVINIARSHILMARLGQDPDGIGALEGAIANLDAYELGDDEAEEE